MTEKKKLTIDPSRLITQAAYGKKKGLSRQLINYMVKTNKLQTIPIEGTVLILQSGDE